MERKKSTIVEILEEINDFIFKFYTNIVSYIDLWGKHFEEIARFKLISLKH